MTARPQRAAARHGTPHGRAAAAQGSGGGGRGYERVPYIPVSHTRAIHTTQSRQTRRTAADGGRRTAEADTTLRQTRRQRCRADSHVTCVYSEANGGAGARGGRPSLALSESRVRRASVKQQRHITSVKQRSITAARAATNRLCGQMLAHKDPTPPHWANRQKEGPPEPWQTTLGDNKFRSKVT